jgi:2-polyprenyl-3-methyl-5-hydroxy-6-metoxy-1,4-benzoquinol methylase
VSQQPLSDRSDAAHPREVGGRTRWKLDLRPLPDAAREPAMQTLVMTGTENRVDRDVFRLAPTMDDGVLETMAERLEFRATDRGYVALSQAYFDRLPLSPPCRVLALGCGTGVEVRALKRRAAPGVALVGIDHSQALVERARRETAAEGLSGRSNTSRETPTTSRTRSRSSTS